MKISSYLVDKNNTKYIFDHIRNIGICVALMIGGDLIVESMFEVLEKIDQKHISIHAIDVKPKIEKEEKLNSIYQKLLNERESCIDAAQTKDNALDCEQIKLSLDKATTKWQESSQGSWEAIKAWKENMRREQNSVFFYGGLTTSLALTVLAFLLLLLNSCEFISNLYSSCYKREYVISRLTFYGFVSLYVFIVLPYFIYSVASNTTFYATFIEKI